MLQQLWKPAWQFLKLLNRIPILGTHAQDNEDIYIKKRLYGNVHLEIIPSSKSVETTQMNINLMNG